MDGTPLFTLADLEAEMTVDGYREYLGHLASRFGWMPRHIRCRTDGTLLGPEQRRIRDAAIHRADPIRVGPFTVRMRTNRHGRERCVPVPKASA